jgi:hypothetical protein
MVAATYTSDLTDLNLCEATTNFGAYGGGAAGLGASPDYAIQGTNAVDKQVSASEKGMMWDNVSNFTIGADDHFFIWLIAGTPGLADTRNNRGIHVSIGDDTSNFVKFHVNGGDTLPLGGLVPYPVRFVNTTLTNVRTLVGTPGTTPSQIGGGANITGTAKFSNFGIDAIRIGTGYDILNGTGADPEANFAGIASDDETTSEGIFQTTGGGFNLQGKLRIGSATTACEFLDSNATIIATDTVVSLTDFTEILIEHASSIVTLDNVVFNALGTNNPGRWELLTDTATTALTGCSFINWGVSILGSNSTHTRCTYILTDAITQNGATLDTCVFDQNIAAAAVISDSISDISDCNFISDGTGHAVEYAPTGAGPFSVNWDGNTDSGYAATDGSTGNETILINPVTASADITLSVINGASTPTIMEAAGYTGTFTLVIAPVTATVKVLDETGADLQNARVLLEASDGTGDLPFQDSVTITHVTTTASVSHTAHGLATGEKVVIRGANQSPYNGPFPITNVTTNAYDYVMGSDPGVDATGTITSTGAVMEGLTSVTGEISDTRSWSIDQNVTGNVRKSTTTPLYKAATITGAVDSAANTLFTVQMQRDD